MLELKSAARHPERVCVFFSVYDVPVTIAVLIARRAGRKAELPFGPSLIAAAWLAAFLGPIALGSLLGR